MKPATRKAAPPRKPDHMKPAGGGGKVVGARAAGKKPAAPSGGKAGGKAGDNKVGAPARLLKPAEVRGFLEALKAANPAPRTELVYTNPFTLLVAVVLSAQTTDVAVNRVTPALFAAAPDPARMAALGAEGIGRLIRTIGLWQAKARHVAALSQLLVERHGGAVPDSREALEALPGVGRKTANVVLNVAFGVATMAVDTHIFRLGNRTGLAPGKTPRAVEDGLMARIPPEYLRDAHHWLILHGRYVCKARRPECWRCVAARWCGYRDKLLAPDGGG